jgi:hypothetical protein
VNDATRRQLCFQLPDVSVQHEKIFHTIEYLKQMMEGHTKQGQTAIQRSPEELAETTRMIDNMEKLVGDTDSYASTILGDEERSVILSEGLSNMSILGQSMAPEKKNRMKTWVSDIRKDTTTTSFPMSSVASITTDNDDATSMVTTTEATVLSSEESKAVSRLVQTTEAMLDAGDVRSAEWSLRQLYSQANFGTESRQSLAKRFYSNERLGTAI